VQRGLSFGSRKHFVPLCSTLRRHDGVMQQKPVAQRGAGLGDGRAKQTFDGVFDPRLLLALAALLATLDQTQPLAAKP
jgi:hypothetical protein